MLSTSSATLSRLGPAAAPLQYPVGLTLCLADDLTGALEAGSPFATAGATVRVLTNPLPDTTALDVLVLDTETRHLEGAAAAARVSAFALPYIPFADRLIYKKTDSTARGNIGHELAALQQLVPSREVLYVPAYPSIGRTVASGHLLVNGTPIHHTEFGRDALNPVRTSNLNEILHPAQGIILDGATEDDVRAVAVRVMANPARYLVAGPAAIARHLGALMASSVTHRSSRDISVSVLSSLRLLVVNGSRHSASGTQMAYARAAGCFRSGQWTEFCLPGGDIALARAQAVGRQVSVILRENRFDGILVFGGDTAYGIFAALGGQYLEPIAEVLPGVPVSRSDSGLLWITKAGGFGPEDLIAKLMRTSIPPHA